MEKHPIELDVSDEEGPEGNIADSDKSDNDTSDDEYLDGRYTQMSAVPGNWMAFRLKKSFPEILDCPNWGTKDIGTTEFPTANKPNGIKNIFMRACNWKSGTPVPVACHRPAVFGAWARKCHANGGACLGRAVVEIGGKVDTTDGIAWKVFKDADGKVIKIENISGPDFNPPAVPAITKEYSHNNLDPTEGANFDIETVTNGKRTLISFFDTYQDPQLGREYSPLKNMMCETRMSQLAGAALKVVFQKDAEKKVHAALKAADEAKAGKVAAAGFGRGTKREAGNVAGIFGMFQKGTGIRREKKR